MNSKLQSYVVFDHEPHLVCHLGMNGSIKFKHEVKVWPPRFWKLLITFKHKESTIEMALVDPRRLSRIRLVCGDPFQSEPINRLGFDPVLCMPDKEQFTQLVQKRAIPVKSLLLDQSFSAGVGNWVADEILYQARVHPNQYTQTLTETEINAIYDKMVYVTEYSVSVEADESKFPMDWLMKYRWRKGKGVGKGELPNGLKLKFITIGGRTSAYAPAVQKLHSTDAIAVREVVKAENEDVVAERVNKVELGLQLDKPIQYRMKKRTRTRPNRTSILPIRGERVVILGCSSGIGKEMAIQYATRGAHLVLFARRKELLESIRAECESAGSPQVYVVAGDVTVEEDVNKVALIVKEKWSGVDTVVYCAGMISVRPFLTSCGIQIEKKDDHCTIQDESQPVDILHKSLQRITDINYFAAVWTARLFLPILIQSSLSPNFLVVSSMAGKVGAPTRALYAGSKHALHGFFDSLRVEVSSYNVHIGLICPGTVDTELRQSAVDKSLGEGQITGSNKNKLSPNAVAQRIIQASDNREREVYIPSWFGYVTIWAKLIASPVVDWAASQKYK
ncbi:hypothetical protein BDB01DRAFT_860323 [Pilobolus umbonatus]|nr:hypothetical protein BDB01DRAFT_860323 [Pilobolus umbonatus]